MRSQRQYEYPEVLVLTFRSCRARTTYAIRLRAFSEIITTSLRVSEIFAIPPEIKANENKWKKIQEQLGRKLFQMIEVYDDCKNFAQDVQEKKNLQLKVSFLESKMIYQCSSLSPRFDEYYMASVYGSKKTEGGESSALACAHTLGSSVSAMPGFAIAIEDGEENESSEEEEEGSGALVPVEDAAGSQKVVFRRGSNGAQSGLQSPPALFAQQDDKKDKAAASGGDEKKQGCLPGPKEGLMANENSPERDPAPVNNNSNNQHTDSQNNTGDSGTNG